MNRAPSWEPSPRERNGGKKIDDKKIFSSGALSGVEPFNGASFQSTTSRNSVASEPKKVCEPPHLSVFPRSVSHPGLMDRVHQDLEQEQEQEQD